MMHHRNTAILGLLAVLSGVFFSETFVFSQNDDEEEVSESEKKEEESPPGGSDIPFWDLTKQPIKTRDGQPVSDVQEFTMTIGEAKIIRMPFKMGSFTLVNTEMIRTKSFADLKDFEGNPRSELGLEARQAGTTTLLVYDDAQRLRYEFRVSVSPHNLTQVVSELKILLATVEGLRIRIVGQRIFLDGEILIPRDMERVLSVVKQYPMVVNLTRMSPDTQNRYAAKIEEAIGKPDVRVWANQGKFIFEGQVENDTERQNIIKIAQTFIPGIYKPESGVKEAETPTIVNLLTLRPAPPAAPEKVIKVLLQYVELSKAFLRSFAFRWAPTFEDTSQITFDLEQEKFKGNLTGTIKNLFPVLNRAVSLNHARILKSITLLVKDGADSASSIVTGIDQPFVSGQTEAGDNIQSFKPVNTQFSVTAKVLQVTGQVNLGIDVSINELISVDGKSTTNQIRTQVLLNKDQSAAIGGFFNEALKRNMGQAPEDKVKIFDMDKRKSYSHDSSRFMIFVTPEVIADPSDIVEATKDFKRKFRLVRDV